MRVREQFATLLARLVIFIGATLGGTGESRIYVAALRLAELILGWCGARLESRVISFMLSQPESHEKFEATLANLVAHLGSHRISVRVRRQHLTNVEAAAHPETCEMYPDGVSSGPESVQFVEVFSPTYQSWKAGRATDRFMRELERKSASGG